MRKLHAQFWWALQYPFWWIAPNSTMFYRVQAQYGRVVAKWLANRSSQETD